MDVKSEQGQTMVEYILLLAVAVSLVMTFYNSELFRRLFGDNGSFGRKIKHTSEFSYRHGLMNGKNGLEDVDRLNPYVPTHPSYYDPNRNGTRFFGAKEKYPE